MLKIQVSTPDRHFHSEIPEGSHWQEALEVFMDGLKAMGYFPPTMEELGGEEVIETLSSKLEQIREIVNGSE